MSVPDSDQNNANKNVQPSRSSKNSVLSARLYKESRVVNIREMAISDYDSVIALWCQTEGMSIRDADSKESIASYLERNPGLSFVAESNNEIIGAVLVGTDGRRGYL